MSTPMLLQLVGEGDRLLEVPAALLPVARGDAHEHGQVLRPGVAHRAHHRQREAHAVGEGAAELVRRAGWRAARGTRAGGSRGPRAPPPPRSRPAARGRRRGGSRPRTPRGRPRTSRAAPDSRRRARRSGPCVRQPPASRASGLPPFHGLSQRGLAPRVRELDAGHRALRLDEGGDGLPRLDLLRGPDAGVPGRDAPVGRHARGLREDEARTAHGAAAQVHEVPVVGDAVLGRVLAHGRHEDAVGDRDANAA